MVCLFWVKDRRNIGGIEKKIKKYEVFGTAGNDKIIQRHDFLTIE